MYIYAGGSGLTPLYPLDWCNESIPAYIEGDKLSREHYKKRLSKELINELIYDYKNKISIKILVEKYDRSCSTLCGYIKCGYIKEEDIKSDEDYGKNVYERKPAQIVIDYGKIIKGKTLKEWQEYNTEINKKYIRRYDLL